MISLLLELNLECNIFTSESEMLKWTKNQIHKCQNVLVKCTSISGPVCTTIHRKYLQGSVALRKNCQTLVLDNVFILLLFWKQQSVLKSLIRSLLECISVVALSIFDIYRFWQQCWKYLFPFENAFSWFCK